MVAPSKIDPRVAIGLETIRHALDDLPQVAEEWAALAEGERVSWSLDWDHLIATYLRLLRRYYRSGALLGEQRADFRQLQSRLETVGPLIERLGLYPPPPPLK